MANLDITKRPRAQRTRSELWDVIRTRPIVNITVIGSIVLIQTDQTLYVMHASYVAQDGVVDKRAQRSVHAKALSASYDAQRARRKRRRKKLTFATVIG